MPVFEVLRTDSRTPNGSLYLPSPRVGSTNTISLSKKKKNTMGLSAVITFKINTQYECFFRI